MKKKYFLLAGLLLLTGCSTPYRESPIATNFKTTKQHKLQSLHHWKVIANDIVAHINPKLKSHKIYLSLPNETTFQKSFNNLLRNALINSGYSIVLNPQNADLTINYNLNVVKFESRKELINRDNIPKYTFLTSAIIVASKNVGTPAAAAGTALATAAGIDAYHFFNSIKTTTPIYEISITLNIKNDKQYVDSVNRVYYVADEDLYNYKNENIIFQIKG